jgi:hypothetical protein
MKSKNISVQIKHNENIPFKETYIIIRKSTQKVSLYQKCIDSQQNQKIELNYEECTRLMSLLVHYVFHDKYEYSKDKVIIYRE